jgi:DNA-binding SARP family transcriptional activator
VDLAEHGWVAAPVAAGVAAAAALVWIPRRRRYRPRPPTAAGRDDPDLTAPPPIIAALHQASPIPSEDDMEDLPPDAREAATVTAPTLGIHGPHTLTLGDLPPLGLGLHGPGAHAAARGLLAAALTAGGPWATTHEAHIITTTTDLTALLDTDSPAGYTHQRLHIAPTTGQALTELERHLLHRARQSSDTTNDLTDPLQPHDDEALPPIILLTAAPTDANATRTAAILAVGARLGITGVLLGPWTPGTTWQIAANGTRTDQPHTRLNTLDTTATLAILDTLREAHPTTDNLTPRQHPNLPTMPAPPPPAPPTQTPPATDHPVADNANPPGHPGTTPPDRATAPASPTGTRLRLVVLGPPAIHLDTDPPTEVHIRRSDGIQLLVCLAVHPEGATSDQLMAALWPDVRPRYARGRFHTTMHELRHTLADTPAGDPITRTGERYHLNPHHIDVDLWHLNNAIDHATTTIDPTQHTTALQQVIHTNTATLAEGHNWLWLAPYREATRRHLIDAHTQLANTTTNPHTALTYIQAAIRIDPYNEALYQHAMHLHATLNNPNGIHHTLHALTQHLNQLEISISPETQHTATQLLDALHTRHPTAGL